MCGSTPAAAAAAFSDRMKPLEEYQAFSIPAARIYYDTDFNCRREFVAASVSDLAGSIKEIGRLLAPLWVQPAVDVPGIPEGFDFRLVAGHRRFKATTLYLKWTEIPCVILTGLSVRQAHLLNFTENLERKDLNPLEEAIAVRRLFGDSPNHSHVMKELKKDSRWVYYRLVLLRMPEEVQQLIASRRVTMVDLEDIRRQDTPELRVKAAQALATARQDKKYNHRSNLASDPVSRKFRRRRNKSEINAMVETMMVKNLHKMSPLIPQALAWCAGHINDDELNIAIDAAVDAYLVMMRQRGT